jgi:general secretion pathway protein D
MRWGWSLMTMAAFAVAAYAADEPQNLTLLSCPQAAAADPACNPSKADLKKSKTAFAEALKLQKSKHFDEAYQEFDTAARLTPGNVEYVTALAMVRQELVLAHLKQGNLDLTNGKLVEAQGEFRSAANLDPQNEFAQQQLRDSMAEWAPKMAETPRVLESAEVRVVPNAGLHEFHFRGDSHALLTQVAAAYGVTAELDDSVPGRRVHFDIEGVDFYTAMRAACDVTAAFWVPLSGKQIYLLRDNNENHRQFDHMALRTFYLPGITTPQEMTEMTTLLRTIFDVRFVSQQPQGGMLTVRAPSLILDAVTKLLENFGSSRPQVLLDIQVFEVDHQLTRALGMHLPNNFTLINVPAGAVAALTGLLGGALGGQNVQSLINQLISSGGINQANSQGIAGLIAQLTGGSGTGPASIFNQPYATFGGGLTLMGLSLDTLSAQLSLNESWVKTLEHSTLRAAQGNEATFRMGSRYPILNASFAPVFNTAAISSVLQNGSFQAPFPSFTYEDLGLTFKIKPVVYSNSDVGMSFEMEFRTLAGQSINGVPVLANREYKGNITLVDGEPAIVAGSLSQNEQLSMTGIPGLGDVPGINTVMTTNSKTEEVDELLLVVTPHVVDASRGQSVEVWLPRVGQ